MNINAISASQERLREEILSYYEHHGSLGDMPDDLDDLERYIMALGNSQAKATAIVAHVASLRVRVDRAFEGNSGTIGTKRAVLGELGSVVDIFKNLTFSVQELLKTAKFIYEVRLEKQDD